MGHTNTSSLFTIMPRHSKSSKSKSSKRKSSSSKRRHKSRRRRSNYGSYSLYPINGFGQGFGGYGHGYGQGFGGFNGGFGGFGNSYGPFNGGYGGYGNSVYGGTFGGFNGGFNNGFNGGAFGGYPQFQQVGGFEQQPQVVEQQPQQEGNVVYQNGGNVGNAYPVQQFGATLAATSVARPLAPRSLAATSARRSAVPVLVAPASVAQALAARVASTERFIPVR